ncbi:MAG: restriction endonuclease subunit S [Spirochaetales bacterium]|nr:restriction endonuclease subunit S [Spirochaetales bacterium]
MAQGVQRFVLSKSQFENISISVPVLSEQEKIASMLTDVDSLITLHQREHMMN